MTQDITDRCQRCERCILAKKTQPQAGAPVGHLLAAEPNQVLAIGFTFLELAWDWGVGGGVGGVAIMMITDAFSKFT